MTSNPQPPPPAADLSYAQYSGWACCWCGTSLLYCSATSAGISRGRSGAHVLDIEVYACPLCARSAGLTPVTDHSGKAL